MKKRLTHVSTWLSPKGGENGTGTVWVKLVPGAIPGRGWTAGARTQVPLTSLIPGWAPHRPLDLANGRATGLPGLPGPKGVVWALDSRPQRRGLLGASAREPDPSWARLQPPRRKGNSGWQEEPRLDPQRLGVVRRKGRRRQMGRSAGGRGGPGGGHVEKWVLLVALLTPPLAI